MSAASIRRELEQIRPRPVRWTRRAEHVAACGAVLALFGLMWLASAVGYWLTGVAG